MLFSNHYGQQQIGDNKKCRQITGDFDCHTDAAVQHGAHRPIEHVKGFTRSHWMPLPGECLRHIAPAATMVDEFVENTLNTNKILLLPSNYRTVLSIASCLWEFHTPNGPPTQLIDATGCVRMWHTTIVAEELSYISSCQTLSANKHSKSY